MKTDYIIITETHLREKQDKEESNISGWIGTITDRKSRSHGRVITYTRDYLAISNQLSFYNGFVETDCCFIKQDNTAVVNIYRPPDCPTDKVSRSHLHDRRLDPDVGGQIGEDAHFNYLW